MEKQQDYAFTGLWNKEHQRNVHFSSLYSGTWSFDLKGAYTLYLATTMKDIILLLKGLIKLPIYKGTLFALVCKQHVTSKAENWPQQTLIISSYIFGIKLKNILNK